MSYKVAIRDNATGEVRIGAYDFEWFKEDGGTDDFWWTEGNMSCDCNRHLEFLRAGGPGPADDPHWNNVEHACGDGAYSVLYAELPDGKRIALQERA